MALREGPSATACPRASGAAFVRSGWAASARSHFSTGSWSLGDAVSRVEGVDRVTVFWRDPADAELVRRACEADDSLSCVSSMPWNFEITDSRATKGSALSYVCERAGFDVADAVAFGDSSNDVSMLLAAGDGVSMANGTPEALAAADHVTELDNDHDGVADYLLRLLGERC